MILSMYTVNCSSPVPVPIILRSRVYYTKKKLLLSAELSLSHGSPCYPRVVLLRCRHSLSSIAVIVNRRLGKAQWYGVFNEIKPKDLGISALDKLPAGLVQAIISCVHTPCQESLPCPLHQPTIESISICSSVNPVQQFFFVQCHHKYILHRSHARRDSGAERYRFLGVRLLTSAISPHYIHGQYYKQFGARDISLQPASSSRE